MAGNDNGLIHVLHHNGEEMVTFDAGDDIRGGIAVADLNNDGSLDLLFSGYHDMLYVWSPLENIQLDGWPIDLGSNSLSEPLVADLDNDGDLEVIAAIKEGSIFIFHHDGTSFNSFPVNLDGNIDASPAIGDIDDDGDFEIAIGTSSGLYILDIKSQKGDQLSWLLHRGNIERTGSLGFTMVSNDENVVTVPSVFGLKQNYPNPFNPVTKIDFSLAISGHANLVLYDITGKKIKSLLSKTLSAGSYSYSFNGSGLSSGMYLYQIDIFDSQGRLAFKQAKKLVLMK